MVCNIFMPLWPFGAPVQVGTIAYGVGSTTQDFNTPRENQSRALNARSNLGKPELSYSQEKCSGHQQMQLERPIIKGYPCVRFLRKRPMAP